MNNTPLSALGNPSKDGGGAEQLLDELAPEHDAPESCPGLMKRFAAMSQAQKVVDPEVGKEGDEAQTLFSAQGSKADDSLPLDESQYALEDAPTSSKSGLAGLIREKLSRLTDPLNHEHHGDESEVANWPRQIHIGFMTQIKKKDLLFHIGEWVADNSSSKSSCFYQIVPYSGGFAYEIQEGGSGRGVLRSALETLGRHSEVIIPSSERYLQLSLKQPGFSSYLLDEYQPRVPSPELVFKDQLKPVFSRHHGLMVAGLLCALLGLAALGSAWFMVYAVYNKDKVPVYAKARYELPSEQLRKVNDILNQPGNYLERLEYKGDRWNLVVKKSDTQAVAHVAPVATVAPVALPNDQDPALKEIQKTLKEAGK